MGLINTNTQADATKDAKLVAVFLHHMTTRLNCFSLLINCSTRARSLYGPFEKKRDLPFEFLRQGMIGNTPRFLDIVRLLSAS